jgi:hypothetical protein
MFKVLLEGEIIADFSEKEDAQAYIEYKHRKLMEGFAAEQVARYIQEHPYTRYGSRTLPGDVPLKDTYPAYKARADDLRADFSIESE